MEKTDNLYVTTLSKTASDAYRYSLILQQNLNYMSYERCNKNPFFGNVFLCIIIC